MATATSIILHHYSASPYAEKIRLALRLKNLAWSSVDIPMMMPKPDLTALTGGYRKTPVMQIGADIYCDTNLILDELETRFKLPTLALPGHEGLSDMVSAWAADWFQQSVSIIFAALVDVMPAEFVEDRRAMAGGTLDVDGMKLSAPMVKDQWRSNLNMLEQRLIGAQITGAGDFMIGAKPGLVDIHAHFNIWWMGQAQPDFLAACLQSTPHVKDWFERISDHKGQSPEPLSAEEAIDIALSAAPRLKPASTSGELRDIQPGETVAVAPSDSGRDWVEGDLVIANAQRVIIARQDERAGNLHVHFPRVGYYLRRV